MDVAIATHFFFLFICPHSTQPHFSEVEPTKEVVVELEEFENKKKRKERKQHVITEKLTPPTRVCRSKLVTAISSGTNLLLLIINNFDPAWHGQ